MAWQNLTYYDVTSRVSAVGTSSVYAAVLTLRKRKRKSQTTPPVIIII